MEPDNLPIDVLKIAVLDGLHKKRWNTTHVRRVAAALIMVADEMDYADEQLADVLAAANRKAAR